MRTKKVKDPWEKLPLSFKEEAMRADEAGLRSMASKVTLDQAALMEAKKKDLDLKEKAEIYKEAGAMYREGAVINKLKGAYLRQTLDHNGCDVPGAKDFLREDPEDADGGGEDV